MVEQKQIAQEYLNLAKMDLEASKILKDRSIINLSVFHLQQAVEKTVKSLCLVLSYDNTHFVFNLNDMKLYHNPLDLLIAIIDNYISELNSYDNQSDTFSTDIKKGVTQQLQERKNAIQKITGKEGINEIKSQLNLLNQIKDSDITNIEKGDVRKILQVNYGKIFSDSDFERVYKKYQENIKKVPLLSLIGKTFLPLSLLGAIAFKHYQSSRYPYERVDNNGLPVIYIRQEEYKVGLGIVDCLEELINLCESVIINLNLQINKVDQ
jgi:hypothetical protein